MDDMDEENDSDSSGYSKLFFFSQQTRDVHRALRDDWSINLDYPSLF